jgi:CheY-like chemotaxis protein
MTASLIPGVILLVEDEGLIREVAAQAIRELGSEVAESPSAETAIAALQVARRIDLIFTDIQLAGALTGWDLAEAARKIWPYVPVIYTSGIQSIAPAGSRTFFRQAL